MSLWDVRAAGWGEDLAGVPSETRRVISLEVIEGSVEFFRPSFQEVFSEETVQLVRSVIGSARSRGVDRGEADQISDRLYDLAEEDPAIGTSSLVAAISLFLDCSVTDFDVDSTLEILSSCYEAVLHTEGISQEALESNRDNENCSRFIDFQWEVIVRASSSE